MKPQGGGADLERTAVALAEFRLGNVLSHHSHRARQVGR